MRLPSFCAQLICNKKYMMNEKNLFQKTGFDFRFNRNITLNPDFF